MFKIFQICFLVCCFSSTAFAQWQLVHDDSSIHFVSVKNSIFAETHYFKNINGVINEEGHMSVNIDLFSVETNVDIRNDRMNSVFFETTFYPKAFIKSELNTLQINEMINKMKVGETGSHRFDLTLSLHGVLQQLSANVQVTRLSKQRIMATTKSPIMLNANDFQLSAGLEALQRLAKLHNISPIVPVTFNLVFQQMK